MKACIRTMADKIDMTKKFRLIEAQVKQMFELVLMFMQDDQHDAKALLSGIANSKVRTPMSVMAHVKAQMSG